MSKCALAYDGHDCDQPMACMKAAIRAFDNVARIDLEDKPSSELVLIWPDNPEHDSIQGIPLEEATQGAYERYIDYMFEIYLEGEGYK